MTKKSERTTASPATDRRRFLLALGAAATALPAGAEARQTDQPPARGHVADAPGGTSALDQRQPFYGVHQAGVVTPRPTNGMVASFNVIAETPADLEKLLRKLTERITFLMHGGRPPALDPKLPPADSGILGPIVEPDNLTITVGFGASLFENRPWLKSLKPKQLAPMAQFPNDALKAGQCHGDLCLQICANAQHTTLHALRDILKTMSEFLVLRWKQEGSVPEVPRKADGTTESARNLLGFRDGSANPDSTNDRLMDGIVWVDDSRGEPAWAVGGTYQVVRIIRNFVERWDRTPLGEQEAIIGRRKMSGAPFDGRTEHDVPTYAKDPDGKVTPVDAHIRLANPRTPGSEKHLILRRPFNYSNGVTKSGQLDQGLLFIAYQADLENGFVAVQKRLNGEPLEEYIKPVGGGYFYVLPGVRKAGDYLGRPLIDAVTRISRS
jgi:deferrochelatase/peroxidase EfeB